MDVLELLVKMGLPSAIIAMVIISYLFKDKFEKLARATLTAAILLMVIIGISQLVAWISGKDVSITYVPKQFYTLSLSGEPVDLRVNVKKGGYSIVTDSIPSLPLDSYVSRVLTVGASKENKVTVLYNDFQQGTINFAELRDTGWIRAGDAVPGDAAPNYWYTHKVFIGETIQLGKVPDAGELSITFYAIKQNKAFVKLTIKGSNPPRPEEIGIENKKIGAQIFSNMPTFHIAVREANFAEEWAAFSIFQY